jgi:hypothetical protein
MLRSVLEHCEGSGLRPWAIDLSSRSSSSPKCYVAATARDFALAMAAVSPLQRHAYEVVRAVPCCAYFDLECTGSQHELEQADEQAAEVARLEARYLEESTMLSWAPLFVSTSVARRSTRNASVSPAGILCYGRTGCWAVSRCSSQDPASQPISFQFPASSSPASIFQFPVSSVRRPASEREAVGEGGGRTLLGCEPGTESPQT